MENGAGVLVFIAIFVVLVIYYYVGGPGGLLGAADARRALRAAAKPSTTPLPRPALSSIASAPGGAAAAGFSRATALEDIERTFSNDLTPFEVRMVDLGDVISAGSLQRMAAGFVQQVLSSELPEGHEEPLSAWFKQNSRDYLIRAAVGAIGGATLTRTLREFSESERNALRLAYILTSLGVLSTPERLMLTVPLVWNEGDCALLPGGSAFHAADRRAKLRECLNDIIVAYFGKRGAAMERIESALRRALAANSTVSKADREVLERHLFAGARWLSPQDNYTNLRPNKESRSALRFGPFFGTSEEMYYDSRQSIFAIAGPGSGKSLMLKRNLVSYKGGAIVLDVKGELYEATAGWRSQNVGPVYRFDPADPHNSVSFNPLDWVRADDFAFEDATILAKALTFAPDKETYWERAGTRMLATAIAKTALTPGRNSRTMADAIAAINDIASNASAVEGEDFDAVYKRSTDAVKAWVDTLERSGQDALYQQARKILTMPPKQRAGVLETADDQLTAWTTNNVVALSQFSDLRGDDFRDGPHGPATLYITIDLDRISYYRSIIRALLACLYRDLTQGVPDRQAPAVTFFLDEMPRLQRMDVLETGLSTGQGYGVRFWFFAQDMSQLDDIYKQAAPGMVDMCAARIHMSPTESKAQVMSRNISEREGLLEGKRKPLADPADLYGPEFRDSIVVMSQGNFPARLRKVLPEDEPKTFGKLLNLPVVTDNQDTSAF
ncbi:type IV secretion system protein VirD4 [Bradyrhizobium sp. LA6.10]|uniref:type IV secretory system conjugative DNA transfer family protein n=1 Tax=Bradyrhizobium sp. LA6.10 TaxID=3156318 RepID=UPI00339AA0EE